MPGPVTDIRSRLFLPGEVGSGKELLPVPQQLIGRLGSVNASQLAYPQTQESLGPAIGNFARALLLSPLTDPRIRVFNPEDLLRLMKAADTQELSMVDIRECGRLVMHFIDHDDDLAIVATSVPSLRLLLAGEPSPEQIVLSIQRLQEIAGYETLTDPVSKTALNRAIKLGDRKGGTPVERATKITSFIVQQGEKTPEQPIEGRILSGLAKVLIKAAEKKPDLAPVAVAVGSIAVYANSDHPHNWHVLAQAHVVSGHKHDLYAALAALAQVSRCELAQPDSEIVSKAARQTRHIETQRLKVS